MELIVQVQGGEALDAALKAGVSGVAVNLPRDPDGSWWAEAGAWQAAARSRGSKLFLQWGSLVREEDLDRARQTLAAAAALNPDALVLRDPGLSREGRRHPGLVLHAAGGWGFHNSPGLRLAASLGFRRVVLESPLNLMDLALLRRQSTVPLETVLPPPCSGFGHLCLLEEYFVRVRGAGVSCCLPSGGPAAPAVRLSTALEMLPSLAQLGVAAVRLGGIFSRADLLARLIELCRQLVEASPAERPRLLAVAREVLEAWGEELCLETPPGGTNSEEIPSRPRTGGPAPPAPRPPKGRLGARPGQVWLEARDYPEAVTLARAWRGPLLLTLTPENYAAFLSQYRHWHPRRLVWRLPPVIRESSLPFFQQAITTLKQGGFSRFVAGDWGALGLIRDGSVEIHGDQGLGIRNSPALAAARELAVTRVCLPPGSPPLWQRLLKAAPRGSFWSYLYYVPTLMACPATEVSASRKAGPGGLKLRWVKEGDYLTLLCPKTPKRLEPWREWFSENGVTPLVVSLPRSGLPRGQVPALAGARPEPRIKP
jgi:collagenase-like PrtC family protease